MCGRFSQSTNRKRLSETFKVSNQLDSTDTPRYNVSPTQTITTIRLSAEGNEREFARLRWGLIPRWAKDPAIGNKLFNARSETITEKPSFRDAFKKRRVLVPTEGFYEWQRQGTNRKQPFYFQMRDGEPFAIAGLWERWEGEDEPIETCSLITTEANELLAPYHDRMPVIIRAEDYDLWLDFSVSKESLLQPLMCPYPSELMSSHRVSHLINNVNNDNPDCTKPI